MRNVLKLLPMAFLAANTAAANDQDFLSGRLTIEPQSFTADEINACLSALVPQKTDDGLTAGGTYEAEVGGVACTARIYDLSDQVSLYASVTKPREGDGRDFYGFTRDICPETKMPDPHSVNYGVGLEKGLFIETVEANDFLGDSAIKDGNPVQREVSVEHWQSGAKIYLYDLERGEDLLTNSPLINAEELTALWNAINGNIQTLISAKDNDGLKSYVESYFRDRPRLVPGNCTIG